MLESREAVVLTYKTSIYRLSVWLWHKPYELPFHPQNTTEISSCIICTLQARKCSLESKSSDFVSQVINDADIIRTQVILTLSQTATLTCCITESLVPGL